MRRSLVFAVTPMVVLFFVGLAFAPTTPIPHLINYQGMLTNDLGEPLDGTYDLTFSIYNVSSGGSALWDEVHVDVLVENGLFNVILGNGTPTPEPIPSSVFEGAERYLGIKVETDPELTPRARLTSVGYAYRAEVADTAYYAIEAVSAETDNDWTISGSDIYSAVSGNVGIGTSSPTAPLTIQPVNGADIEFAGGGGWNADIKANNQFNIGTANGSTFHLMTDNTYRLSISGDGNVGIGTTSPDVDLDVYGTQIINATRDGIVNIGNTSGMHVTLDNNEIHGRNGSNTSDLYINDFGGDVLIAGVGDVGMGITTPGAKLHVRDGSYGRGIIDGSTRGSLVLGDNNDATDQKYFAIRSDGEKLSIGKVNDAFNVHSLSFAILRSNGYTGLGTSSPLERLHVAGKVYISTMSGTSSGNYVRWYNGRLYYYSSSEKYKEDIQPLEEDFDRILKAEPKSFIDKASGERNIGFIAEEFDEMGLDNLVTYRDGQPDALKYELVSLYLLEVVKDLKEKNGELERRIGELESRE